MGKYWEDVKLRQNFSLARKSCGAIKIDMRVPSAKNSTLPLLYAMCLTGQSCELRDLPNGLLDLENTLQLLASLRVSIFRSGNSIKLRCEEIEIDNMKNKLCGLTRYSSLLLGVLAGKRSFGRVPLPGGCSLNRKMDIHFDGLRALGFDVVETADKVVFSRKSHGESYFRLSTPSVGATLNLIFASCGAPSSVRLENCACEPEVLDVADFINACGGKIKYDKLGRIDIEPCTFHDSSWAPIPDRIIAGTYALAAGLLGYSISISPFVEEHNEALLRLLTTTGLPHFFDPHQMKLDVLGASVSELKPFALDAAPYPGFPTDLQPIAASYATKCSGVSTINEGVYGGDRYQYAQVLQSLGAEVVARGSKLFIGGRYYSPAASNHFECMDIRGGMSCILFAMSKLNKFVVDNLDVVRRGYGDLEGVIHDFGFEQIRPKETDIATRLDRSQLVSDQVIFKKLF
jgi:UDP-N-acetylglucosamine 1-carboxyvinyltransferase